MKCPLTDEEIKAAIWSVRKEGEWSNDCDRAIATAAYRKALMDLQARRVANGAVVPPELRQMIAEMEEEA